MTRNKSHIVILISELNVAGGLERIAVALANELSRLQYCVSILVIGKTIQSFFTIDSAIPVHLLQADFGIGSAGNYLSRKLKFIKDLKAFKRKLNTMHADIVISFEYQFTVAAVLAGYRKRKIITWQQSSFFMRKSRVWQTLFYYSLHKVHTIVCLNESERKLYSRFKSPKVVIPNFFTSWNERSFLNNKTILTVARLVENKGIDLLMQCAEIVLSQHSEWKWIVIGEGVFKEKLETFILQKKLLKRLVLQAPASENLSDCYKNASIFVMTSKVEPFGLVLIEAMSSGVPCVAFDCEAGPRHIIHHNLDGYLIEPFDVTKMAAAIGKILSDENLKQQLGKQAHENVKRFHKDVVIKQWQHLLDTINPS